MDYGNNVMISGLFNSVKFISDMLVAYGFESKHVDVFDGNSIDREAYNYKPTHLFLDALWVTPEKLIEVTKLHPKVKWYVRIHSELPFIALEGIAMQWLFDYIDIPAPIHLTANSQRIGGSLSKLLKVPVPYLPNYYPIGYAPAYHRDNHKPFIDIACFGAVRQLKNQFTQAIAAMQFAEGIGKRLRFHMNSSRQEGSHALTILKNLRYLFDNKPEHELIEHGWLERPDFVKLMQTMDLSMQVTFSETFNIVSADAVANHIPVVVSPEVQWVSGRYKASPTSVEDIVDVMHIAWFDSRYGLHNMNILLLMWSNYNSVGLWTKFLMTHTHHTHHK